MAESGALERLQRLAEQADGVVLTEAQPVKTKASSAPYSFLAPGKHGGRVGRHAILALAALMVRRPPAI